MRLGEALGTTFEVFDYRRADWLLSHVAAEECADLHAVLSALVFTDSDLTTPGGSKSRIVKRLEGAFAHRGWLIDHAFVVKRVISVVGPHGERYAAREIEAGTHKIDALRGHVAIEIEWNSKESVFARDLGAFRLLYDEGAIVAGVVITRADRHGANSIDVAARGLSTAVGGKYGAGTTHLGRLRSFCANGYAGGCPVLGVGITTASRRGSNG